MMMNELNELFPRTWQVLNDYGEDFVVKYREGLQDKDAIATGNLFREVRYELVVGSEAFELRLRLPDYAEWLEEGVKNKGRTAFFPPVEPIYDWVVAKGIVPRRDDQGRLPTQQQLAYMIARQRDKSNPNLPGFKVQGRHIFQETYDATQEEWIARINEALDQDIEENVMAILETLL